MNALVILFFALIKVSTVFTGPIKKIRAQGKDIYTLTVHAVFKNGKLFSGTEDVLLDMWVEEDTLWILARRFGELNTYIEAFDKKGHSVYRAEGARNAAYFEKGKGFWLFGNDFYADLKKESVWRFSLTGAHVISDSLIAGYKRFSDTFLVLKPIFTSTGFILDTLLVEPEAGRPENIRVYKDTMYVLTRDERVYMLWCGVICHFKLLYHDLSREFYYINRVRNNIWLSADRFTYIFRLQSDTLIGPVDSIENVRIKDIAQVDTVLYLLNYDGVLTDSLMQERYSHIRGVIFLSGSQDTLKLIFGGHPALSLFENPFSVSFRTFDTFKVKYFQMGENGMYYLLADGSIYNVSEGKIIAEDVNIPFVLLSGNLYFMRHDSLIRYNLISDSEEEKRGYPGEGIFYIKKYNNDILVFTRDTGMRNIFIHMQDTALHEINTLKIAAGAGLFTLYEPYICESILYVPYVYPATNEYRIRRINLENLLAEREFMGYGSVLSLTCFSPDTLYILERPYGAQDVRIVVVDFANNETQVSTFIGTGGGSIIALEGFLIVSSDGKVDVFDTGYFTPKRDFPVVPLGNIIHDGELLLYSLFTLPLELEIRIINVMGSVVFTKDVTVERGYNTLSIPPMPDGMYILFLQSRKLHKNESFKLIYLNDRK